MRQVRRARQVRQARETRHAPRAPSAPGAPSAKGTKSPTYTYNASDSQKNNQINYKPNASGKALAETPRAFRPLSGKTPPISRAAPARATNPCHVGTPRGKKARVCILCSVLFGEMSRTNPRRKEKSSLPRSQFFLFHRPPLLSPSRTQRASSDLDRERGNSAKRAGDALHG